MWKMQQTMELCHTKHYWLMRWIAKTMNQLMWKVTQILHLFCTLQAPLGFPKGLCSPISMYSTMRTIRSKFGTEHVLRILKLGICKSVTYFFIYLRSQDGDVKRYLTVVPWYHGYGLVTSLSNILREKTMVFLTAFNPELYLKAIQKYKVCAILY